MNDAVLNGKGLRPALPIRPHRTTTDRPHETTSSSRPQSLIDKPTTAAAPSAARGVTAITYRIAFCITDLDPGGAEQALVRLASGLDRQRWQVRVYCLGTEGRLAATLRQAGVPTLCLGAGSPRDIRVVGELARELRSYRPQLLQTFLFHANLAGRLAAWKAGVPHVVSGIRVADRRSRLRLWADRLTERLVDCHVCVSQGVADFSIHRGGLSPSKVHVIPNGVEAAAWSQAQPADLTRWGLPPKCDVILFVGRLDPQKAPLDALMALRNTLRDQPSRHLVYVGCGPLEKALKERIEAFGLTGNVHLVGRQDDVASLMAASRVLVLPSRWEGMPNVVLEAMASGLPVVATSVEGVRELIEDGVSGLLVPPGDLSALQQAVARLLDEPERAQQLAKNAQHVVSERFTWDRMIRDYERLYLEILEPTAGSEPAKSGCRD